MVSQMALAWQRALDRLFPLSATASTLEPMVSCWACTAVLQALLGLVLPTIILAHLELRDRYKFAQARGLAYAMTLRELLWNSMLQYGAILMAVCVYSALYCCVATL